MDKLFDIGIIGGGPAGYSAAIRASQKGLKVVLFEKDCMGGVCLNRGCIPTKTVLHCSDYYKSLKKAEKFGVTLGEKSYDYEKVFNRKNDVVSKIQKSLVKLVQSYGVEIVPSEAFLSSSTTIEAGDKVFVCKNIIIATGSKPAQVEGLEADGEFVLNSNDVLELSELPENILIVGSGAIGIEWARIFSAFEKNVTIVEMADRLLPIADFDISKRLDRLLKKDKVKVFTGVKVESIVDKAVTLSNGNVLNPDMILSAIGREPVLPESFSAFEKDGRFVKVNGYFQTNFDNIFAIGDANGKSMLAHSAIHQSLAVIDFIADGKQCHFDTNAVPSVIYGNPEIAWVGKREQDFADSSESWDEKGYKVSSFPVAALGKAQADDELDGFVKVLSVDDKIVGAHIVSPEASSLVQQFALMIDNGLSVEDIKKTTFSHPTYSEAVFEAVLGLNGEALHLPGV